CSILLHTTATILTYTLSLHDALPICNKCRSVNAWVAICTHADTLDGFSWVFGVNANVKLVEALGHGEVPRIKARLSVGIGHCPARRPPHFKRHTINRRAILGFCLNINVVTPTSLLLIEPTRFNYTPVRFAWCKLRRLNGHAALDEARVNITRQVGHGAVHSGGYRGDKRLLSLLLGGCWLRRLVAALDRLHVFIDDIGPTVHRKTIEFGIAVEGHALDLNACGLVPGVDLCQHSRD